MYNIWGFFLQTIAVSIVAGIILVLKKIFEDKLSPKWQYAIWSLLAIRILVPVNVSSYVVPQIALLMEMVKASVESVIPTSTYTQVYEPITVHHIIPVITANAQSGTDCLFLIYIAGVMVFLLKYFVAYIRLRLMLKQRSNVNRVMELKLLSVSDTYGLKPCKMIAVNGLSSAFICGVFRPVLVIPAE
jgi:beta-lactamase regulating signal transducer with metallopeptidase domain